jgi:metal-responsive CopG/Arc/MetJ family transcriptional regulator
VQIRRSCYAQAHSIALTNAVGCAAMKDSLVRFGVALERSLLRELDGVVRERGGTRSELFWDLARATVGRSKLRQAVDAIATLTPVYDHHVGA